MYHGDTIEQILEQIGNEIGKNWGGERGEKDRIEKNTFIEQKLSQYSERLGMDRLSILRAFERARNVNCMNWYQECHLPNLEKVEVIVKDGKEFLARFPSKKFICPFCQGETSDPQECNSGLMVKNIKGGKKTVCNWKSYGLFGTMGKGVQVLIIDDFLAGVGQVHDIFRPIELPI